MSNPRLKAAVHITHVAPLGMKFYDTVRRSLQTDLVVTVAPVNKSVYRTKMFCNMNNVFVVNRPYGLNDLLQNGASRSYWEDISGQERPYHIEVNAPTSRFIPFSFAAPLPHKGYFVPECMTITDPAKTPDFPANMILLYPGVNYRPPAHMALIQAQLYDPVAETPAAYAVIDALYEGTLLARGIADIKGNLMLCFDYPNPNGDPLDGGSGSGDNNNENDALQWSLDLRAFYTRFPAKERYPNIPDIPEFADICHTFSQIRANLWADWTGSEAASTGKMTDVTLKFRVGQQLKSSTTVITLPQSHLFITPTS